MLQKYARTLDQKCYKNCQNSLVEQQNVVVSMLNFAWPEMVTVCDVTVHRNTITEVISGAFAYRYTEL